MLPPEIAITWKVPARCRRASTSADRPARSPMSTATTTAAAPGSLRPTTSWTIARTWRRTCALTSSRRGPAAHELNQRRALDGSGEANAGQRGPALLIEGAKVAVGLRAPDCRGHPQPPTSGPLIAPGGDQGPTHRQSYAARRCRGSGARQPDVRRVHGERGAELGGLRVRAHQALEVNRPVGTGASAAASHIGLRLAQEWRIRELRPRHDCRARHRRPPTRSPRPPATRAGIAAQTPLRPASSSPPGRRAMDAARGRTTPRSRPRPGARAPATPPHLARLRRCNMRAQRRSAAERRIRRPNGRM